VNHFPNVRYLFDIWRFLAEYRLQDVTISADMRTLDKRSVRRSNLAVQVLAAHSIAGCAGVVPDVPQRGAEQERQTADRRISGKRDPGRHGKRNRRPNHNHPNHRRQQHKPCQHFPQPPRETEVKDARDAWQECGRVLVKVRRTIEKLRNSVEETMRGISEKSSSGGAVWKMQPRVEVEADPAEVIRNHMNKLYFLDSLAWAANPAAGSDDAQLGAPGTAAAKWRNFGGLIRHTVREVHEECLSFVIPRQQGRPAKGYGVVR
jgi:hypothetical protein